jgi:hypothetical protein
MATPIKYAREAEEFRPLLIETKIEGLLNNQHAADRLGIN